MFGARRHSEAVEERTRTSGTLGAGHAREDERQRHVVDNAIARKQVERLEHHPHPLGAMACQAGLIQSREVLAVDADPPGRGPLKARDDVKERRLS